MIKLLKMLGIPTHGTGEWLPDHALKCFYCKKPIDPSEVHENCKHCNAKTAKNTGQLRVIRVKVLRERLPWYVRVFNLRRPSIKAVNSRDEKFINTYFNVE